MKALLPITAIVLLAACHKSSNTDPNNYTHLTQQQIWDTAGFKFGVKYWQYDPNQNEPSLNIDTVIFNSSGIAEEKTIYGIRIFAYSYTTTDTQYVPYPGAPLGRYIYSTIHATIDTPHSNDGYFQLYSKLKTTDCKLLNLKGVHNYINIDETGTPLNYTYY